jgi:hypothetical protein
VNETKQQKPRLTQEDWVFIQEMDPNRPDIVHAVSEKVLNSNSDTESQQDEEASNESSEIPVSFSNRRGTDRKREALPITLNPQDISATVLAGHDTY